MVAEPRPPGVERRDEGVRVLEALQDRLRARAAGQRVGERAADPLEHGGAQEQVAHLRRLALQHLRQQVARHGALAAGELGDEPLGIGVPGERDRRQPQAGGPPFGPLVEQRQTRVGERDARSRPAAARVSSSEKRRSAAADLGQRARQPQPMQPEPRVLARREHHPQRRRQAGQEALEQAQRLRRAQLVQIVDRPARPAAPASAGRTAAARRPPRRRRPAWRRPAPPARPPPTAPASSSMTDSQKRCASRSPRSTDTQATRSASPSDSTQERSSAVLPLPAGAHTRTTSPGPARDSRSNSGRRGTSPRAAGRRPWRPWATTAGSERGPATAMRGASLSRTGTRQNPDRAFSGPLGSP